MIVNQKDMLQKEGYLEAVTHLLFQLADDDFILAYRGSEWLGLAPHIEEDVAFSSISQDTMGHAAMFYSLLEELGAGDADKLAHARLAKDRKNAILLELANGPGTYLNEPQYDWAFTVVRNFFYVQAKKVKILSLKNTSYQPMAEAAVKVNMELYYHLLHWKTWFMQLIGAGGEARTRMEKAVTDVFKDLGGLFSQGATAVAFGENQLIDTEEQLIAAWKHEMTPIFDSLEMKMPKKFGMEKGDGRNGEHTQDLEAAIETLSEVYRLDVKASW
nr:1,2-phenylacetyl-CoA epoxidase subunit PaaC [Bacillus mediterraneensis]